MSLQLAQPEFLDQGGASVVVESAAAIGAAANTMIRIEDEVMLIDTWSRCRAIWSTVRKSGPDSGLGLSRFSGGEPHTRGTSLGGVPREQKMLKGHLPRVIYHQVFY